MEKMIIQYIRDKKNSPRGVMVAFKQDGVAHVGWSLCSKHDEYDKQRGWDIAIGRAKKNVDKEEIEIAQSAFIDYYWFCDKIRNKFKDCKFPKWMVGEKG